jgi:pyruvate/2-oxoglutarate dehydrogenase complex dihydrolipoamide acyltransferase (E2) component
MKVNVIMPKQGLQMEEGTILKWTVREGETVNANQKIAEVETDKTAIDIFAPVGGIITVICFGAGTTVPVSETIAVIDNQL